MCAHADLRAEYVRVTGLGGSALAHSVGWSRLWDDIFSLSVSWSWWQMWLVDARGISGAAGQVCQDMIMCGGVVETFVEIGRSQEDRTR